MKIGIDLSIVQVNQAGTGLYTRNLVAELQRMAGVTLRPFAVNQSRDMTAPKTLQSRLSTIYRDLLWMHVLVPLHARRAQVDLLHMPANVMPVAPLCPTVVTILDTTIFHNPKHFPIWHRLYSHIFTPLAAHRAKRVMTISQQSKRDIVKQFQISPDKVVVAELAAAPHFRPVTVAESAAVRQKYGLKRFVLTVGTLEPRKNMPRLLQALAAVRQAGSDVALIHCGPSGWLFDNIEAEVKRLDLQDTVRFLGRVPVDELVQLYNAADVFVYPSLYEGFGLPVLEAMQCGSPVVTSNISSLPEVAGDAALLIDPHNVAELAAAIQQVLDNPALADELRHKGLERAKGYSWQRCAQKTAAVYRQVLDA